MLVEFILFSTLFCFKLMGTDSKIVEMYQCVDTKLTIQWRRTAIGFHYSYQLHINVRFSIFQKKNITAVVTCGISEKKEMLHHIRDFLWLMLQIVFQNWVHILVSNTTMKSKCLHLIE